MTIVFPTSPAVNDTFTSASGFRWRWDGAKWVAATDQIFIGDAPSDGHVYFRKDGEWVRPVIAPGTRILIESRTVTSATTLLNFTEGFDGTYDDFEFIWSNVLTSAASVALAFRVSTDGGATFNAGTNYIYAIIVGDSQSVAANSGNLTYGQIGASIWGGAQHPTNIVGTFTRTPTGQSHVATMHYSLIGTRATSGVWFTTHGANQVNNVSGLQSFNAIQFFASSGNITNCVFTLYGIAK